MIDHTLTVDERIVVPGSELSFTFARSSGPGGQNVNKVNSKATLHWQPALSESLPFDVRERFLAKFANRLTLEGELQIMSQSFRDQGRNIQECLDKLAEMLRSVAVAPKKRRPIKVSRAAKRRRLESKGKQSDKKDSRRTRFNRDD